MVIDLPPKMTDEYLISELQRAARNYGRTPCNRDMGKKNGYPSWVVYVDHFGSWNQALLLAGLSPNKSRLNGDEFCELCGSLRPGSNWNYLNGQRVCSNCCKRSRNFITGKLDPKTSTAIGIITERVVMNVLNDSVLCNTNEGFHAKFDLVSDKYGTVNVKSSKYKVYVRRPNGKWLFSIKTTSKTPDNYVCIGYNKDRTSVEHVWIIPGNSSIISKSDICITNIPESLTKVEMYEVDPTPYNEVYKNLDITTLPEFRNLKTE